MIGSYIPKRQFRPFYLAGDVDHEKYSEVSGSDKKIIIGVLSMVALTAAGILFIVSFIDEFSNKDDIYINHIICGWSRIIYFK